MSNPLHEPPFGLQSAPMARSSRILMLLALAGTALAVPPAAAQFGSIFRQESPRPPADIPSGPPSNSFPPQAPPPQDMPSTTRRPPPRVIEPLPVPATLPPAGGPRGGHPIQTQPLPPPPGATAAPEPPPRQQQAPMSAPGQQPVPATAPGQPTPPPERSEAALPPTQVIVEPPPQRIANPTAVFAGLDKITGRITSFDVAVDETVQFGALQVTPRVCYSRPPTETPRTDAFLDVDEVTLQGEVRRIFTGWMFAASPGLHAVEHPIYDIWLTDCKGGTLNVAGAEDKAATAAPATPPRRR